MLMNCVGNVGFVFPNTKQTNLKISEHSHAIYFLLSKTFFNFNYPLTHIDLIT